MREGRRGGARRPDAAYLTLLLFQLYQQVQSIPGPKPPVTLSLMAVQALIFLAPFLMDADDMGLPSIHSSCLCPHATVFKGEWQRLVLAAFLHADEHHLYYNLASLLWKGVQLERSMGSARFAALLAELLIVSHSLVVIASYLLASFGPPDYLDLPQSLCAVGFSAVLFGMKVVLNHNSPGWSNILGIPFPTRFLCWGELVLSSLLFPQASFLGHLCGILAGFIHIKVTKPTLQEFSRWLRGERITRPTVFSGRGRSGYGSQRGTAPTPARDRAPAPVPAPAPAPAPSFHHPSNEEVREIRLRRFQRE